MKHLTIKIVILLLGLSLYFDQSKSDASILGELDTALSSFVNHPEVINKKPLEEEFTGIPWNEWYERCRALPFYRVIGTNYDNTAINDWKELDQAIEKFIQTNIEILSKSEHWLEDAPNPNDSLFSELGSPLSPIKPFAQKLTLEPGSKIAFHGDFHGDVHSIVEYIQRLNTDGYMDGFKIKAPDFYLIFLGDYEDRGNYGTEVWYTLMRLKIANPDHVIIIRGNHEDQRMTNKYGFTIEFLTKFDKDFLEQFNKIGVWGREIFKNESPKINKFFRIYDFLPPVLYLGIGNDVLKNYLVCVHGGIEEDFNPQRLLEFQSNLAYQWLKNASTHEFPSDYTIGFMWSDFQIDSTEETTASTRNAGKIYSKLFTEEFLNFYSNSDKGYVLKGIFRAHQHASEPHPFMEAMKEGNGVAKLWKADDIHNGKNLWDGIVCTFLVGPDTSYGAANKYNWDGFGILTTAEKFEDWHLDMFKIEVIPEPKGSVD